MLNDFKGTLVADEFDESHNTELGAELSKILCQGFQARRPLIKCTGDANIPKAFSCCGPKLFALRGRFSDDACESRTISVRMSQRTRPDVPISLPRRKFDAEALAIRNMMLGWRFQNLGSMSIDPMLADDQLEDRNNQIGLPLLSIALDGETRGRIGKALRSQQSSVAESRSDSLAGGVFRAAMTLAKVGEIVRPAEVAREMNRRTAEDEGIDVEKLKKPVNSYVVGRILGSSLELPRDGRDAQGVRYRLDPARVEQLIARYGDVPEQTTQTTQTTFDLETTPENPDPEPETAESVVCVDSVVSTGVRADTTAWAKT